MYSFADTLMRVRRMRSGALPGCGRLPLVVASLLAPGAAMACAERMPDVVVEADSAGVRIVESRAPTWPPGTEWRVDPEPVFRLGGAEADPAHRFHQILDVALLAGGALIVVDGGSAEVRHYDAGGRHLWSIGGRGEGPGEFRSPRYLGRRADGAFLIWDRSLLRLSVIEHGEVTLAERRTAPDGSVFIAEGLFDDGAWLVAYPRSASLEEGAAWTDTIRLGRYDPVSEEDAPLATVPGTQWVWTGRYQLPVPFSARPLRAIVGRRLAVASGSAAEVSVHDLDGSPVARYRIAREAEPVTDADVAQVIESLVDIGQGPAEVWRRWHDRMEVPAYEPAFDRLLADGDGNLWARRFMVDPLTREPPSWDVFDREGHYLGAVSTPGGTIVTTIRDGRVAGVFRDELGVEHVGVHRLVPA